MKIRCAIFDFDGTLFDSMPFWENVGEIYLRSQGKEAKPSLREDVRAMSLDQAACYLRKEYGLSLSEEEIVEGINQTVEHYYLWEILPKPGVVDFLKKMKTSGISMCIATAADRRHILAALRRCGMEQYFDVIFTCGEVGHGKDEPVIFQKAMEFFGADRSTSVVFEDAFHAAQTAKNDGFTVVAVSDASEKRQDELGDLADCRITDFAHADHFWKFASAE